MPQPFVYRWQRRFPSLVSFRWVGRHFKTGGKRTFEWKTADFDYDGRENEKKIHEKQKNKKKKSKKTGNTEKMKLLMKRDVVWLEGKHHGKPSGKVIISSCSQFSSFVPHRTQLPPPLSSKQQEPCKRLFPVWVLPRWVRRLKILWKLNRRKRKIKTERRIEKRKRTKNCEEK